MQNVGCMTLSQAVVSYSVSFYSYYALKSMTNEFTRQELSNTFTNVMTTAFADWSCITDPTDVIKVFTFFIQVIFFYVLRFFKFFRVFYLKMLSKAKYEYAKIQRETLLEPPQQWFLLTSVLLSLWDKDNGSDSESHWLLI